jgi:hypothetical protein
VTEDKGAVVLVSIFDVDRHAHAKASNANPATRPRAWPGDDNSAPSNSQTSNEGKMIKRGP